MYIRWWVGDLTFFEALPGGAFDHKKSSRGSLRSQASFGIDLHYPPFTTTT